MDAHAKTPWPGTYLGRLQAVTVELRHIGAPASVEILLSRFSGVTAEQIEATLAALVLFGRVDKKGELFSAADS
ncbi:MAG: hypothetical protein ABJF10_21050 [Chthoniobacter sp.]|uniref:hypothetical protein n=1 Tax=Chthoniobacter sp. TaxID=2510640 RepID=UPI0032ACDF1F